LFDVGQYENKQIVYSYKTKQPTPSEWVVLLPKPIPMREFTLLGVMNVEKVYWLHKFFELMLSVSA